MRPPIEEPTVTYDDSPCGGEISNHPAFGQISASRVSGSMNLYGSDFTHNGFIVVSIRRSELRRDLSKDWFHERDALIEVAMSEAQWATFVSSMNHGSGPCCTIEHIAGKAMPSLPDPVERTAQFSKEVNEQLAECMDEIRDAITKLDNMGLPKGKAASLRESYEQVLMHLKSNLPFIAESFSKHAETTVEKAKQEIHGYMQNIVQRVGLASLADSMPLLLEDRSADPVEPLKHIQPTSD